ncbi:hypothetical protein J1N35_007756, partial [Gossypium stocksii]
QVEYWAYVRSRDLTLRKSLQNNFTKLMPESPIFLATLLSFADATKEPTQATTKAPTQPAIEAPTQTTGEEPKKMASLNVKKEGEGEKEDIATTATTKGKNPIPPSPLALVPAQDYDIDCLINELTKDDKEREEMTPKKRKWRYKVSARKFSRRA